MVRGESRPLSRFIGMKKSVIERWLKVTPQCSGPLSTGSRLDERITQKSMQLSPSQ